MDGPNNQSVDVTQPRGKYVDNNKDEFDGDELLNEDADNVPTSQTTNVASNHGSSSISSGNAAIAQVLPQQVYSASGGKAEGLQIDCRPTPASTASIVVAAVSPIGKFMLLKEKK